MKQRIITESEYDVTEMPDSEEYELGDEVNEEYELGDELDANNNPIYTEQVTLEEIGTFNPDYTAHERKKRLQKPQKAQEDENAMAFTKEFTGKN